MRNFWSRVRGGEPRTGHTHAGIDLQTRKAYTTHVGQPVYSMCDGVVQFVGSNAGYGPYVIIYNPTNHDLWLFGDMDSNIVVTQGQNILQGQQIGFEGNPARNSVNRVARSYGKRKSR